MTAFTEECGGGRGGGGGGKHHSTDATEMSSNREGVWPIAILQELFSQSSSEYSVGMESEF